MLYRPPTGPAYLFLTYMSRRRHTETEVLMSYSAAKSQAGPILKASHFSSRSIDKKVADFGEPGIVDNAVKKKISN